MDNETYTLSAIIEHKTDKAILIKEAGDNVWLPLSMIKIDGDSLESDDLQLDELVEIEMPKWLAQKKDLI